MMEEDWNDTFYDLFREAVGRYHEGNYLSVFHRLPHAGIV